MLIRLFAILILSTFWANCVLLKPGVYTPTLKKHQAVRDLKKFENHWAKGKITPAVILSHRGKIDTTQKRYVVHHNTLSDSFQIRIVWFQSIQDSDVDIIFKKQDRIG